MLTLNTIVSSPQGTVSALLINDMFVCNTLELPWLYNKKGVSCIPAGSYEIVLEYSPAFKSHLWEIKGVPGRDECKIHSGNWLKQIKGCILPGTTVKYDNKLKQYITTSSKPMLKKIHGLLDGVTKTIIDINGRPFVS